jgi:hypothetical protein
MTDDLIRRIELAAECGRWKGTVEVALIWLAIGDIPAAMRTLQERLAAETK